MSVLGGNRRWTFRRDYARGSLGAFVLSAVLAVAGALFVPRMLPATTTHSTRATLTVAAVVALIGIVWGSMLWVRNIRVVVTDERIEVWRPFLRLHQWDRGCTNFSSVITERRTRGRHTITTRALIAFHGRATTTVDLPGFNRRTFAALLATLNPPPHRSEHSPFDAQYPSTGASEFRIELRPLWTAARTLALAGGITALLAAAGVAMLFRSGTGGGGIPPLALVPTAVGVASLGLLIAAASVARAAGDLPERVCVSGSGLEIDGTEHSFGLLRSIEVAPSTYSTKRIVLVGLDGDRTVFTLGRKGAVMCPEYGQFVRALIESNVLSPGLVTFDLG